jgi:DNA-binding response OmpR family regulator
MKILCIDDAPDILEVLDLTIKIKWPDWQVLTAENGPAGLALFDEENPDLVIVDLGMPEMDGYEVIRRLRRRSGVPIIILTVRDDEESMAQGFDVGADDYMVKPFGQMELTGRIQAVLRRTSQEQNDRG